MCDRAVLLMRWMLFIICLNRCFLVFLGPWRLCYFFASCWFFGCWFSWNCWRMLFNLLYDQGVLFVQSVIYEDL